MNALALAQSLAACAVCGSSKAENDLAFGITTLVLSVLPPILFGVGLFLILRAHKKARREEQAGIAPPAE